MANEKLRKAQEAVRAGRHGEAMLLFVQCAEQGITQAFAEIGSLLTQSGTD